MELESRNKGLTIREDPISNLNFLDLRLNEEKQFEREICVGKLTRTGMHILQSAYRFLAGPDPARAQPGICISRGYGLAQKIASSINVHFSNLYKDINVHLLQATSVIYLKIWMMRGSSLEKCQFR